MHLIFCFFSIVQYWMVLEVVVNSTTSTNIRINNAYTSLLTAYSIFQRLLRFVHPFGIVPTCTYWLWALHIFGCGHFVYVCNGINTKDELNTLNALRCMVYLKSNHISANSHHTIHVRNITEWKWFGTR